MSEFFQKSLLEKHQRFFVLFREAWRECHKNYNAILNNVERFQDFSLIDLILGAIVNGRVAHARIAESGTISVILVNGGRKMLLFCLSKSSFTFFSNIFLCWTVILFNLNNQKMRQKLSRHIYLTLHSKSKTERVIPNDLAYTEAPIFANPNLFLARQT